MTPDSPIPCRTFPVWKYLICFLTLAVLVILGLSLVRDIIPEDKAHEGAILLIVADARTGSALDGADVYMDGGFMGVTSNSTGTLVISGIEEGPHTIRVTDTGYRPVSKTVTTPGEPLLTISLSDSPLVPLTPKNNNNHAINIVFIPSSTYFRTSDDTKISTTAYTGNETQFKDDVTRIISNTFDKLGAVTDPAVPLPQDYPGTLNFYYYYDPAHPADAFSGCAGTVPGQYWDNVTFSDLTVILYPHYDGWYLNTSDQPVGCYVDNGPGHKLMKIPANRETLAYHEMGHGLFGLADTYCGDTTYFENDPYPNIWSSKNGCTASATADNRDPVNCREILSDPGDPVSCTVDFWRFDPDPDIMKTGGYGTFGATSTKRIAYVLTLSGEGTT